MDRAGPEPPAPAPEHPEESTPPDRPPASPVRRAVFLIGAATVLILMGAFLVPRARGDSGAPSWKGTLVDPASPKPEFTLTDTSGQPYDFAARTKGQLTFLYFGYTNCPDVCPIHMATLAQALHDQSGVAATVVFVTTDPARDTPQRIRSWLDGFDTHFVGLTGTPDQLAAAQRAAGVGVAQADEPGKNGDYLVGHSTAIFAYTPDGLGHLQYPFGITESEWLADLPRITAMTAWQHQGAT